MNSVYTSTITTAAIARGISVDILDHDLPIFELSYGSERIRCYNGLTDRVGGATFHLAQNKGAANRFLRSQGIPVAAQEIFSEFKSAVQFLKSYKSIVVKPSSQWGGRGVSTHISNEKDLKAAINFSRRFSDEIILEECVSGIDWRLIFINYSFVCAIQRDHAVICGDGMSTIGDLIKSKNAKAKKKDPSNIVPLDKETRRTLESAGLSYSTIPANGTIVQVRRTSNYHTGGTVDIVTNSIPQALIEVGTKIARLLNIPVLGIDMLVDPVSNNFKIIELSPDMAISPPEGEIVVEAFLDFLFPATTREHEYNDDYHTVCNVAG